MQLGAEIDILAELPVTPWGNFLDTFFRQPYKRAKASTARLPELKMSAAPHLVGGAQNGRNGRASCHPYWKIVQKGV